VSNLVTMAILQSLVVRCLSLFFSIIHQYRILSHNELKFVTHIFQIFRGVNAHLIYRLCKLGLFWFKQNHTEVFATETIDSNYNKLRNQIQFEF